MQFSGRGYFSWLQHNFKCTNNVQVSLGLTWQMNKKRVTCSQVNNFCSLQVLPQHSQYYRAFAIFKHEIYAFPRPRQIRSPPIQNGKGNLQFLNWDVMGDAFSGVTLPLSRFNRINEFLEKESSMKIFIYSDFFYRRVKRKEVLIFLTCFDYLSHPEVCSALLCLTHYFIRPSLRITSSLLCVFFWVWIKLPVQDFLHL